MANFKAYIDNQVLSSVIGTLIQNPYLINRTDKYSFLEEDFEEGSGNLFYQGIYSAINNLVVLGESKITPITIDEYLSHRPRLYQEFESRNGLEMLTKLSKAPLDNFNRYYDKMKKLTLFRMYTKYGIDLRWLYDPDSLNIEKKSAQEDWLDSTPLIEIGNTIHNKLEEVRSKYLNSQVEKGFHGGHNLFELKENLKKAPEVGISFYGDLINTVTRGARLKKFYLRSAPTGIGKSRINIADATYFAIDEIYDEYQQAWVKTSPCQPSLYITTELELEEVQTIMIAFVSGVNEEIILDGVYPNPEDEARVDYAIEVLKRSKLWISVLTDFSLDDIENTIRSHVIENNVTHVAFDYIHTSLGLLEEISRKGAGMKMREDTILFMLSIRLKDLANELGVFIMSSTQLNGTWEDKQDVNQNAIRGSKSIADKIDFGAIMLQPTEFDLQNLSKIISEGQTITPNFVYHVYKNRRSKFNAVKIWCYADLGTGRVRPLFITSNNYKLLPTYALKIEVEE